ncbi:hypothetical protein [Pseudomonas savastanoi]|uniref:hypothetical protein n=1 Tax=Pseudomonas savastanoi TaxID=29438 RepID=UPI000E327DE8|nr:hypothetical protein [Pseudomonas savastanoi]
MKVKVWESFPPPSQCNEDIELNPFDEPVSLQGIKLVRTFFSTLTNLAGDRQLSKRATEIWGNGLAETGGSEDQIRVVGVWFNEHYQTWPALPTIVQAVKVLHETGTLPAERLENKSELAAMAFLQAADALGLSPFECSDALILAGTLAHYAGYRREHPRMSQASVQHDIAGYAEWGNSVANEILDEIQDGKGALRDLKDYLFKAAPGDESGS